MTNAIIVDKSFLDGTSAVRIQELAQAHRLLVSDALFYELLTTRKSSRTSCFKKIPPIENSVDLVSHIGPLMRFEIENQVPAGRPSERPENASFDFQFNSDLTSRDYELPGEAWLEIEKHTNELRDEVGAYLDRVALVPTFFPDLLKGSTENRAAVFDEAEKAIAEPGALLPMYSGLEPPPGQKELPPADKVDEAWAVYRYLQVQMLFGLDVYFRYQGKVPDLSIPNVFTKMEHDVLDAEVLMLGCLEGAFATREKKLKRWWRLLCPNGELYD